MKSSPLLLSAFTARSLNYLCPFCTRSLRWACGCPWPGWAAGQREDTKVVATAAGRAKHPGPNSRHTAQTFSLQKCTQLVTSSTFQAADKTLLSLPRMCSVEVCLIQLNLHPMAECFLESSANCPARKQFQTWKKRKEQ